MKTTWKDILNDFLELGCRLTSEERQNVLKQLETFELKSSHIDTHPAFSVDGHLFLMAEPEEQPVFWLYSRKEKSIYRLVRKEEEMQIQR